MLPPKASLFAVFAVAAACALAAGPGSALAADWSVHTDWTPYAGYRYLAAPAPAAPAGRPLPWSPAPVAPVAPAPQVQVVPAPATYYPAYPAYTTYSVYSPYSSYGAYPAYYRSAYYPAYVPAPRFRSRYHVFPRYRHHRPYRHHGSGWSFGWSGYGGWGGGLFYTHRGRHHRFSIGWGF